MSTFKMKREQKNIIFFSVNLLIFFFFFSIVLQRKEGLQEVASSYPAPKIPQKRCQLCVPRLSFYSFYLNPRVSWVSLRSALFTVKAIVRLSDFKNPKSQLLQSSFTANLCFPAVYICTETQTHHYSSATS